MDSPARKDEAPVARADQIINVFNPKLGGNPVLKIPAPPGVVTRLAYSPDGKWILP